MKIFKNIRGSMKNVPSIEVNVDTVYIRSNIVAIDEQDFKGWEYDEIQYDKNNYIELISKKNEELEGELADVWFDTMSKEIQINQNEEDIADLWFENMKGEI